MLIKGFDVGPAALKEIHSMIEEHGECCVKFLEQKFDVLILPGDQIEVYQRQKRRRFKGERISQKNSFEVGGWRDY